MPPVYLLTQSYLTSDGWRERYSGLQRYVRELTRLIVERGRECVVLQKAAIDFDRTWSPGVRVVGIRATGRAWADPWFNLRAHSRIPADALVIYCLVELAYPCLRANSIAIQHGVWWDGDFPAWKLAVIRALNRRVLRKARALICVDTNYINWCLDVLGLRRLVFGKCHYVPNFVDEQEFPVPDGLDEPETGRPLTVLFPRRCEEARGALLFLDACLKLWREGYRFRAIFCGAGSLQQRVAGAARSAGFADLVEVLDVSFAEMSGVYDRSDIVAIPTVEHEGTSLACIEAMRKRKPLVTTYVGGLPNLLSPGFNGEMTAPTVEGLARGLARLLRSGDLRERYARNGLALAESLTLRRWQDSVWRLAQETLPREQSVREEVRALGA